jgi:subtilisin family serine protease
VTCLAYQVAPKARLLIVKVASPPQKTSLSFSRWTAYRFAAGILWAARNGADVINLSYASTWDIPAFREACRFCWKRNIILVAAAGNALNDHDRDLYYYPAAYPWTIAVGGAEKKGEALEVWENSARGDYLDVLAPATGFWVQFPSYLSLRIPPQLTLGNSLAAPIV